jgi:hypothetical protein
MLWRQPLFLLALAGMSLLLVQPVLAADTATVTGKISFNGKPLPGGKVFFHPPVGKPIEVKVNADGTYSVKNVPVGQLKISIKAKPLPKKYASPDTSGLVYQPQKGENQFDIELK